MDEKDKINNLEKEIPVSEQEEHFEGAKPEAKPEGSESEAAELESIKELLESEVHKMDADPELKKQAQVQANQIASLGVEDLMVHFEQIANTKGLVSAFSAVKKTNSPFILDRFHDFMIEGGRYKKFPL